MPSLRRGWQGKKEMKEYSNSQISAVIEEYIHSKRNRELLKRRYVDGITFEKLSEEFELSVRQAKTIVYKAEKILFSHV